jgi:hypothetical protein
VLEPDVPDAHGDIFPMEEVEKAAHDFMRHSQMVGVQHTQPAGAQVIESFISPVDMAIGDQNVLKGTWVMSIHVPDTELWKAVKEGAFTGLSIGAIGKRVVV